MTPDHTAEYFHTARGSKIESVNRNLIDKEKPEVCQIS